MTDLPRFARWLIVSMDNKGMSGRKLAKLLDYHDTSVSKWKAGEATPSVATLVKIAKIFDVPPTRLLVTARPDEFKAEDFGEPLPVPARAAYRTRIREHIRSMPIEERDAQDLEELFAITQLMRDGEGGDLNGHLAKAVDALATLRKIIKGEEGQRA
jgi:transcriptional regulator with XRE-family HTH domain